MSAKLSGRERPQLVLGPRVGRVLVRETMVERARSQLTGVVLAGVLQTEAALARALIQLVSLERVPMEGVWVPMP